MNKPAYDQSSSLSANTSRDESSDSISLNGFDGDADADGGGIDPTELEGVALLRQIFPDESTEELRQLHRRRVSLGGTPSSSASTPAHPISSSPSSDPVVPRHEQNGNIDGDSSALRRRILQKFGSQIALNSPVHQSQGMSRYILPHDFLRLPPTVAVRRYEDPNCNNGSQGKWRYQLVRDLAERAIQQHEILCEPSNEEGQNDNHHCTYYTRAVFRDAHVGLGIALCERDGAVLVHSVVARLHQVPRNSNSVSSPRSSEMEPGDELIGVNGTALLETRNPGESLVRHAVVVVGESPDPVVLHFRKMTTLMMLAGASPPGRGLTSVAASPSRTGSVATGSTQYYDSAFDEQHSHHVYRSTPTKGTPLIHPFATALRAQGLLNSYEQERDTTLHLEEITDRVRQWEGASSLHVHYGSEWDDYGSSTTTTGGGALHPFDGVRKALSVRILNSFVDGSRSAYCIWVHDAEAGIEFFSPVRYLRDFHDLRSATMRLCPPLSNLPFPREPFTLFGSPVRQESAREREAKCRTLENFVRSLCTLPYRATVDEDAALPELAEVAVHVQSFLGYGSVLESNGCSLLPTDVGIGAGGGSVDSAKSMLRAALKRSVQLYTYRLFLLDGLAGAVRSFVDAMRDRGPNLDDLEGLEAQGRSALKDRAMTDLQSIQSFLDWIQGLILEACRDDFMSIASRGEYADLFPTPSNDAASRILSAAWLDPFVREAVREQVEIEVYVPLRGVASRWLVRGWRHEDMEVQFKIKELRRRRQHPLLYGREATIDAKSATTGQDAEASWSLAASRILSERVGRSTLPCVKLRAIVDAAREISRHFAAATKDRSNGGGDDTTDGTSRDPWLLGADDFLPLFMHCVVQADIERPCALCVLLKMLCDPMNRMGEIGYYLASFEATIAHIQEFDLSATTEVDDTYPNNDDGEHDVTSFLSVPLNASP
jgi:Vacuolar sorting protein 9 (VPS9) domain